MPVPRIHCALCFGQMTHVPVRAVRLLCDSVWLDYTAPVLTVGYTVLCSGCTVPVVRLHCVCAFGTLYPCSGYTLLCLCYRKSVPEVRSLCL